MRAMGTDEVLTIGRLRQWAAERCALKNGKTLSYKNVGRPQASGCTNRYDAALVRVIDFERALETLPIDERLVLILTYRDKQDMPRIAVAIGCSMRKLDYLLPKARKHLAAELERQNLL